MPDLLSQPEYRVDLDQSFAAKNLTPYEEELVKDYLIKVKKGIIESSELTIENIFITEHDQESPVSYYEEYYFYEKEKRYQDYAQVFFGTFLFKGYPFIFTIKTCLIDNQGEDWHYSRLSVTCPKSQDAISIDRILDFILSEAIRNSSFKNRFLTIRQLSTNPAMTGGDFPYFSIEIKSFEKISIPLTFISEDKLDLIHKFIRLALNYHNLKQTMRYLFSGPPGTGKTQLINNIAKELEGKVTTILLKDNIYQLFRLFEFAKYFDPVVIIIDDLDFIAKDRNDSYSTDNLRNFLSYLDGMMPAHVFLLAATNSKKLVDIAASRPGRFDVILDIGEILPENYMQLVKRETDNLKIIDFFDEDILKLLEQKRVTGAFIVNLIKQLKTSIYYSPEFSKEKFRKLFDTLYEGFYGNNDYQNGKIIGFHSKNN